MSLWGFVCSVHLCKSVRKRTHLRVVGRFFSHRAHRVNRAFLRTFRAHRTPPAYRVHRGLSAIIITKKGHNEAYILFIGVSRWLRPFPSGEGKGEGPLSFWTLCVLFICVLCEKKYVILYLSLCHSVFKKTSVSLRHSVILSSKKHLFLSVTLLFCLTKITSFSPSLCYSVFKTTPSVSPVLMLLCLQNYPIYLCH